VKAKAKPLEEAVGQLLADATEHGEERSHAATLTC
jgi:hypothetical protein